MNQCFYIFDDDFYCPPSSAQSVHTASSGSSHAGKKVQKNFNNYASVECGAKILGSNPEAKVLYIPKDNTGWWNVDSYLTESLQSTSAILMENMDMYMLNPCSNKIWYVHRFSTYELLWMSVLIGLFLFSLRFIIELCEPVQVKQLDIANFELFSSTPKDFLVSISDRWVL